MLQKFSELCTNRNYSTVFQNFQAGQLFTEPELNYQLQKDRNNYTSLKTSIVYLLVETFHRIHIQTRLKQQTKNIHIYHVVVVFLVHKYNNSFLIRLILKLQQRHSYHILTQQNC